MLIIKLSLEPLKNNPTAINPSHKIIFVGKQKHYYWQS